MLAIPASSELSRVLKSWSTSETSSRVDLPADAAGRSTIVQAQQKTGDAFALAEADYRVVIGFGASRGLFWKIN
jgi:hypothetical protein